MDDSYPTPITAVPRATSGTIQTFNKSGTAEDGRWIDAGDVCTIKAVYTDGWLQVSYPSGSTTRTAYVAKDVFFASNGIINGSWSPSSNVTSYRYDNLTESFGSVFSTDSCVVVGQSGSSLQVIYPTSSGYKLGWVSESGGYVPPDPIPDPVPVPGPIAEGAFDGKGVVVMAPERIDFGSNEYIAAGDVCILTNIDPSTGYCDVTYPIGGDDVFTCRQKDERVAISRFIEYQPKFAIQKVTAGEQYGVFPRSDMQTYGRAWYLDPGDDFYTVARAGNGATEVLYYCTRGKHEGWWKLGWVDLPYYWLDLNGWLDGSASGDLGSYGAADVYVNGNELVGRARDFYSSNGTFPRGSTYEIKNIVASEGYTYNGVHSGSASGTLRENTSVSLDFAKDPTYCANLRIKHKPNRTEYVEGERLDLAGMVVESVAIDGTVTDVTDKCAVSGFDSTSGVKTVDVSYGGKSTAFTVVVKGKTPTKLNIISTPIKTEFLVHEVLSLDGLKVNVCFDNGTNCDVDDYEIIMVEDVTSTIGIKIITVAYQYNGVVVGANFNISVSEYVSITEDGWVDLGGGRKGYRRGGGLVAGWLDLDGRKYWFGEDHAMRTGWLTLGDHKYWFHDDGAMATGWADVVVDGKVMHYYFNPASGNLVRSTWFTIDGAKYYFRPSGNVAHGWATISDSGVDKKYYFDDDYRLVTGWRDIENDKGQVNHYYFRPSGSMATGWATIDGQSYWFRPSGNMATGFTTVDDGFKRYFDESGHMLVGWQVIDGRTFYFRASGAMQTGRATIDGVTYVFTDNGTLSSVVVSGQSEGEALMSAQGALGSLGLGPGDVEVVVEPGEE